MCVCLVKYDWYCRMDLVSSVQQLLCGLSGEMEVPAATAGEMEDFLANLETIDKNFNRYIHINVRTYSTVHWLESGADGAVSKVLFCIPTASHYIVTGIHSFPVRTNTLGT